MKGSVTISDITAAPGEKKFGYMKIGESPAFDISLPIGIVNGSEEGPRICLIAGSHPCEYPGIDATIRLYQETNPSELKGTIVTVPVVNILGFDRYISYVCPIDGLNLSFQVPGKLDGNFSQLTNYYLEKIVYESNYFMDLHGAELNELLIAYTIFYKTGSEKVDSVTAEMARLAGTPFIEQRTEEGAGKYWPTTTLFVGAPKRGIPSIVVESGVGLGSYDEGDILNHVNGVRNILKYLKMLPGEPTKPAIKQRMFNDSQEVRVKHGGLFYPVVKLGDIVKRSQKLGFVKNLEGRVVEDVISSEDGFVHMIIPKHVVNTTDVVFYIGKNVRDL
jgi:predicted deacylase